MNSLYWIVGVLAVMNVGTILTVAGAAGRGLWWLSKLDGRVERNKIDINNAHIKIRELENQWREQ